MKPKIDVLRAVLVRVARRTLFLLSIIGGAISVVVLAVIWTLAHYASNWWWLLLILYVPLVVLSATLMLAARLLVRRVAPPGLSRQHNKLIDHFVDTIQQLLATHGISWSAFALLNVKDILFYRELRTVRELLAHTTSLRKDFAELEERLQV